MAFSYPYPRPAVTADAVVFSMRADDLAVLLVRRKGEPFKGCWALPGGFVNANEPLVHAAARELAEETGLTGVAFEQLGAFGDPGRDPRGHTVSVVFYTYIVAEPAPLRAGDDAAEVAWYPLRALPLPFNEVEAGTTTAPHVTRARSRSKKAIARLAFDHATIIERARVRLHEHLHEPWRASVIQLLPPRFTLIEFQRVYEAVLGSPMNQRTFRTTIARPLVAPATTKRAGERSLLYRWKFAPR